MPLKENQHQNYAYEVIPLLFHNETAKFFLHLRRDGNQFLKFWWDRAGLNLDEALRSSAEGLDHDFKTYQDGRDVILIKLPPPKKAPEAYFLIMVDRPKKRGIFPWQNLARVFALSRSIDDDGTPKTVLAELTRTARYVKIGEGSKPTLNSFYKLVCESLGHKNKPFWRR
jgi:hypothetical protein